MKFSKHFKLSHHQAELDFIDIDSNEDLPLFFDPYVFANEQDIFSRECGTLIQSFFGVVLEYVRTKKEDAGRQLLQYLQEPNEFCLGWSSGKPRGRGLGRFQADQVYSRLAGSEAARSGLMSDLQDCELFIDGIGPDKISDITANILRGKLIEYTQEQCALHGITKLAHVASGPVWDPNNMCWTNTYVDLPLLGKGPVVLVPKRAVRWLGDLSHLHQRYYRHFVLNFLKQEHLRANSGLVHVLKKGGLRVYKTELEERYPLSKDFLFRFSRDNPVVLEQYKQAYKRTKNVEASELEKDFDAGLFADALIARLAQIPPGIQHADAYHKFMVGLLEFIFHPNLTNPRPETPIHGGQKRIDITYVNSARDGFFFRMHTQHKITSIWIMVECKNYHGDPKNPELDQLSGRFSPNRGRFGILTCRKLDDRNKFMERCRNNAADDHGYVLPLADDDVIRLLEMTKQKKWSDMDRYLESIFRHLM